MNIDVLKGKTITSIEKKYYECDKPIELIFTLDNGEKYLMFHSQECCEEVWLEDINGNLSDLLNNTLLVADEETKENEGGYIESWDESYTWTFYKLATIKGFVVLRWYGASNGYYSERVEIKKIE